MSLLDVLRRAEDGHAERRALEGARVEVVKDDLLHVALHLLHLAQDDAALALDGVLVERAVLRDVSQDVHR